MGEQTQTKTYTGGCHCGAVRYEVDLDLSDGVGRCNCSICVKLGKSGVTTKPSSFRLLQGEDSLSDYEVGGGVGHYRFCKRCGIHSFSDGNIPEIGGEFVGINVNCLDGVDAPRMKALYMDGRHDNWMAGARPEPWPIYPENESKA